MAVRRKATRDADKTLGQLSSNIDELDPDSDHGVWSKAMMVVHNETDASEDGFELCDAWSSRGTKYKGTKDVGSTLHSFH